MKKILLFILVSLAYQAFATGPSNMGLEIHPLSVSDQGKVLARASYYSNPMGAQMQMPITYSYLVIEAQGFMHNYEYYTVDTMDQRPWEEQWAEVELWKQKFNMPVDFDNPEPALERVLREHPGFIANNAQQFKVDQTFTLESLQEHYPEVVSSRQISLGGHLSVEVFREIRVLYAFPDFLLTENQDNLSEKIGAQFDFTYKIGGYDEDFSFAHYTIHAILPLEPK
jgi:hypothetical protein